MSSPSALEADIGFFLRQMMGILSSRTMSSEDKLHSGGMLIKNRIGSRRASVMLLDENRKQLRVVAAVRRELVGLTQPLSPDSISGYVCSKGEPLLIEDIAADGRFCCRNSTYTTSSLVSVPLMSDQGEVIGVFNASDKVGEAPFSAADLDLLLEYSGWISPLIETLCVQERLEKERERYRNLAGELKIKQEQLTRSSEERAELVQMVVHDFKSPLSAIISNMDLLSYLGPSDSQKPIIDTVFRGATNLLEMIDEFLHVARVDECRENGFTAVPVPFLPLLRQKIEELNPLAQTRGIHIRNTCILDVQVLGDAMLLGHMVQNLISNAIKYSPEKTTITMGMDSWESRRTKDPTRHVLKFWVEDQGEGIDDAHKESIFKKFVRMEKSVDSGIKGTGIGLYVCHRIMTMLHGRIWVEDATPCGSRFCVILFIPEDRCHG